MYSILAAQTLREIIGIPDIHSIASMWCVFGVFYLVICIASFANGPIAGIVTNCGFLTLGIIILILGQSSFCQKRIYYRQAEEIKSSEDLISRVRYEGGVYHNYYEDKADGWIQNLDYQVYAINDPLAKNDDDPDAWKFYIPHWVFHPSCLFWCPFWGALPVVLVGMLVVSKK